MKQLKMFTNKPKMTASASHWSQPKVPIIMIIMIKWHFLIDDPLLFYERRAFFIPSNFIIFFLKKEKNSRNNKSISVGETRI